MNFTTLVMLASRIARGALLTLGAALVLAVSAQAQSGAKGPVLKGKQVTETALVDALAIPDPQAPAGAMRGFRPATVPNQKPKRYGPGKASLLVTFATGSTEPAPESLGVLDALGKAMQSDALAGVSFRVEGHADARGSAADNMTLSQSRAESVANYLASKHGILRERLKPEGKGSNEPMNKSRVDAPENRRVTVVSFRG